MCLGVAVFRTLTSLLYISWGASSDADVIQSRVRFVLNNLWAFFPHFSVFQQKLKKKKIKKKRHSLDLKESESSPGSLEKCGADSHHGKGVLPKTPHYTGYFLFAQKRPQNSQRPVWVCSICICKKQHHCQIMKQCILNYYKVVQLSRLCYPILMFLSVRLPNYIVLCVLCSLLG